MSALEGRWAQMPNGRLVRIIGVDEDMVIAETTSGTTVDRPLAHVQARWTLLADDSLTVLAATNPDAVKARLQANPVDLVVDAIRELGGEAETVRIQELLERTVGSWVGTGDDFKDWWRRVQQKLGADSRIDDSRSLERRYRLLEEGEGKRQPLRDRVSEEERGGRRLAFAPLLKSARERAHAKRPRLTDDERVELQREAALADLPGLDPTDRFMAAELGTWIGRQTVAEASAVLAEDLLLLDLLRIPHKASRDAALDWLSTWLDSHLEDWTWHGIGAPPTLASAAAQGDPWATAAAALAARIGVSRGAMVEGAVSWSYPGSDESKPWKLPADYLPYLGRLHKIEALLMAADPEVLVGIERGALRALAGLAASPKNATRTDEVLTGLARLSAGARRRLANEAKAATVVVAQLQPDRLVALLNVPSGGGAPAGTYLSAVEAAFERDPEAFGGAVTLVGRLIDEDPGAIAARVIRKVAKRDRMATMALVAMDIASDPRVRADSAALAGTAGSDDPRVVPELMKIANAAAEAVLAGEVATPGTLVFSAASWRAFAARMFARVDEAVTNERLALAAAAAAEKRIEDAAAVAEQARGALATSRMSTETQSRVSTSRLAANILKPIALALADSVEAPSLEALQDRLAAALDRARIEPILQPGEIRPFDPDVHRWVDDGDPTDLVTAVSPGFIAHLEGEDDVVLVPARVVAPPQP